MMIKLEDVYRSARLDSIHYLYWPIPIISVARTHKMYSVTPWFSAKMETDLGRLCSLLTAAVWLELNTTNDYIKLGVKDLADNNISAKELMMKWARLLETSHTFPSSLLDVVTIINATLFIFSRVITK